jgi:hypothetical protein
MRLLGRRLSRGYDGEQQEEIVKWEGITISLGKKGQLGRGVRCGDRGCQDIASRYCRIWS